MDAAKYIFRVMAADEAGKPVRLLGTAFPIAPNGVLLTCRHVAESPLESRERLSLYDWHGRYLTSELDVDYSSPFPVDLAVLRTNDKQIVGTFLPILDFRHVLTGLDVYSPGFYSLGSKAADVVPAYFRGNVVNLYGNRSADPGNRMSLSYAVIEGMSGSPVLTYHNGTKATGICIGSDTQRIVVRETVEYRDAQTEYHETVSRFVELGVAYQAITIVAFVQHLKGVPFVVSAERIGPDN